MHTLSHSSDHVSAGSTRRSTKWLAGAIVVLAFAAIASGAEAVTRTWTGAASNLWSDPGNWGGTAPVAGDDLVFPTGASNTANSNDLAAGTLFNSITIETAAMGSYVVTGNDVLLGPGGLTIGGVVTMGLSVTLAADQTWSSIPPGAVFSVVTGAVHLNGRTLTLDVEYGLTLSGTIDGTGALIKDGFQFLTLSGANTYAGPTTVSSGVLVAASTTALGVADGSTANGTTVSNLNFAIGASLQVAGVALGNEAVTLDGFGWVGGSVLASSGTASLSGPVTLARNAVVSPGPSLTLSGVVSGPGQLSVLGSGANTLTLANSGNTFTGGVSVTSGTLALGAAQSIPGAPAVSLGPAGTLALNGHAQTLVGITGTGTMATAAPGVLTLNGTGDTTFGGAITGTGTIVHTGTGRHAFTGTSTFSGPLSVDHGLVAVSGTLPATVTVNNDGRLSLSANGAVGAVTVNDGRLQLIDGGAAIGRTGTLTLDSGATVDIGGAAPAAFGRLQVTGSVTLGAATLAVQLPSGFTAAVGATFTIVDNDGSDPVGGTFAGLSEGATVHAGGLGFRISYAGGTGNDVVLALGSDYLLTEGATGTFFTTDVLLANPNAQPAPVRITFLKSDGTVVALDDTLAAQSHKAIRVNDVAGMAEATFSTIVSSTGGFPLAVERTMSWDQQGYGAHTERATEGAATQWYFAEGSQGFFHTYLLLANPQATANRATVEYLRESGPPVTRTYDLAPSSRRTVDAAADPELVNRSFGMTVTFDAPGAAERAMYFGDSPLFNGGHGSAGVTVPSTTWFLAEGATGPFFETFLLLANPGNAAATATVTYLPDTGSPVTTSKTIGPHARVTINIEQEAPALANVAVSTTVASTQPILVERSQYWPDPAPRWHEAHNSFGVVATGTRWAFADGRVGGANEAQTYVMVANPGTSAANITVTFLRGGGAAPVTKTYVVPPTSRFNVRTGPGTPVPELTEESFGGLITSDQPIAVEKALFWNAAGQIWAAGTNANATRLP